MNFIVISRFPASVAERREAVRPAHSAYIDSLGDAIVEAGPLLEEHGAAIGSLLLIKADDHAAATAIAEADPYSAIRNALEVVAYRPVFVGGKRI